MRVASASWETDVGIVERVREQLEAHRERGHDLDRVVVEVLRDQPPLLLLRVHEPAQEPAALLVRAAQELEVVRSRSARAFTGSVTSRRIPSKASSSPVLAEDGHGPQLDPDRLAVLPPPP